MEEQTTKTRIDNVGHQGNSSSQSDYLKSDKLISATIALKGENGFMVEENEFGRAFLIGYASPIAYRGFVSSGWAVLGVQNLADAFAPITKLRKKFISLSSYFSWDNQL